MNKRCVVCGMQFSAKTRANTCSKECREKRKDLKITEWKNNQKRVVKKESLARKSLSEINELARQEGLTYGEYVARYGG